MLPQHSPPWAQPRVETKGLSPGAGEHFAQVTQEATRRTSPDTQLLSSRLRNQGHLGALGTQWEG